MIAPKKIAIDMSSFLWRALLAGVDKGNGIKTFFNEKEVTVNSAEYGYENITKMLVALLNSQGFQPIDTILVFEGKSSKARRVLIDSTYKGGGAASHPPEAYLQFQILRERIGLQWQGLGATQMVQDLAEGDDTLAWLAQEYPGELLIATYDNDLSALNTEEGETNAYGGTCKVWIDGAVSLCKYGAFDFKRVHIYKTLVGDTSDAIPGCIGFGPAAFFKLVDLIGWDGIDELEALLDKNSLDDLHALAEETIPSKKAVPDLTPLAKLCKKIVASEASVINAWKVVKLRPEWVNTMKNPLEIIAGKVALLSPDADERLVQWYGENYLVTAGNYGDALETVETLGKLSPFIAFDIETSTPQESDDWLVGCGDPDGVDTIGSTLTGFSLTFGANMQHTVYVSVDHADTDNITMAQARGMLELVWSLGLDTVVHNTYFELPVLYGAQDEDGTFWSDHWKENGYRGFVPRALDTKLEASYVDENLRNDLKLRAKAHLGYDQVNYKEVTTIDGVQYKMRELSAEHVTAYASDDTSVTAALHSYFQLALQLEHAWDAYLETEIDVAYLNALSFYGGMEVSIEKSKELEKLDDVTYSESWACVRSYLLKCNWDGTQPPTYTAAITAKEIKQAYAIVTDQLTAFEEDDSEEDEDEKEIQIDDLILKSKVRTPAKLVALIRSEGQEVFASMLERCLVGDADNFTTYVRSHFKGEPIWKFGNKNMSNLIYRVMGCPIKIRGKVTDKMRARGIYEGTPKADSVAIAYALVDMQGDEEVCEVLKSLRLMQMVRTRRSLYYSKWPAFKHWKTGRVHASHLQASTVTRRDSESKPNRQQIGKSEKIEGEPQRYREVIVPHKPGAVIVSVDLSGQELRHICNFSSDPEMMSCFIGDNKKDMHLLTGTSILKLKEPKAGWTYERAVQALEDTNHIDNKKVKNARRTGKTTNFGVAYLAMAKTLSLTMMCSEQEAQLNIDAHEATFGVSSQWKQSVIASAEKEGYAVDAVGGRRHLREALRGGRWEEQQRATRQAVNFMVQSTSAAQTKRAAGQMWRDKLFDRYDSEYVMSCHAEHVASVSKEDAVEFIKEFHACMVRPFEGMWVPIESDISIGLNYGELVEVGKMADTQAIEKVLLELV
jgi:DNA polymerase I-like protein with 3'-5' exonuclease and polymerase domains/5'-3' exonuclease